jgi:AraC-like DNA-binding protein
MDQISQASPLPLLRFLSANLTDHEASLQWRQVMAPLFHVERSRYSSNLPRGELSVFVVGEIMVNRCTFNGQHLWRDRALIDATPDHLVLQYYRSGGFRGLIAGRPVCITRGQVTVADLTQEIDAYAASSDTIGLSIPRPLLEGIDPASLSLQLDGAGNHMLGTYMAALPRRLALLTESDIPAITIEIKSVLARVFNAPPAAGGHDAPPANDLLGQALTLIEARLGMVDLSPSRLSGWLGISRATLYRMFAPMGGIMRYVQERRLNAVRDALSDPLDRRSIAQIAAAHGFSSPAVLSRGFRETYAMAPRDWRRERTAFELARQKPSPAKIHELWRELGQPL